jgi:hypothetical protein
MRIMTPVPAGIEPDWTGNATNIEIPIQPIEE